MGKSKDLKNRERITTTVTIDHRMMLEYLVEEKGLTISKIIERGLNCVFENEYKNEYLKYQQQKSNV